MPKQNRIKTKRRPKLLERFTIGFFRSILPSTAHTHKLTETQKKECENKKKMYEYEYEHAWT